MNRMQIKHSTYRKKVRATRKEQLTALPFLVCHWMTIEVLRKEERTISSFPTIRVPTFCVARRLVTAVSFSSNAKAAVVKLSGQYSNQGENGLQQAGLVEDCYGTKYTCKVAVYRACVCLAVPVMLGTKI